MYGQIDNKFAGGAAEGRRTQNLRCSPASSRDDAPGYAPLCSDLLSRFSLCLAALTTDIKFIFSGRYLFTKRRQYPRPQMHATLFCTVFTEPEAGIRKPDTCCGSLMKQGKSH